MSSALQPLIEAFHTISKLQVFQMMRLSTSVLPAVATGTPPRDWLCHGYFRSSKQLLLDMNCIMAGADPRTADTPASSEVTDCEDCLARADRRVPERPPRAIDLRLQL